MRKSRPPTQHRAEPVDDHAEFDDAEQLLLALPIDPDSRGEVRSALEARC